MASLAVQVPRLEDEIEQAWQTWRDSLEGWSNGIDHGETGFLDGNRREIFEAGFRAARTFEIDLRS